MWHLHYHLPWDGQGLLWVWGSNPLQLSKWSSICDNSQVNSCEPSSKFEMIILVSDKNVKLILVGDSLQIAPVSNGSPFRLLLNRDHQRVMLKDVVRQKDPIQREAAIKIREGNAIEGLSMLYKSGNIKCNSDKSDVFLKVKQFCSSVKPFTLSLPWVQP